MLDVQFALEEFNHNILKTKITKGSERQIQRDVFILQFGTKIIK